MKRGAWFLSLVFLPFLIQAIAYLKQLTHFLLVRNDAGYPEGGLVYAFLTAFHTGRLYTSPFDFPFNPQPYGPVYYLAGSLLAAISHGDPALTTLLGRLLSITSYFGSAAIIGYLCWRLEKRARWVTIAVILSLASVWVIPFAASTRADLPSILLILGALTFYVVAEGNSRLIFLAGVAGTLSCFTKQTTAPVLIALAIDSLMGRRFRQTAVLIAGAVPVPALILGAMWLRHEPFLINFTVQKHAILDWGSAVPTAIEFVDTNQMAIIPICVALLGAGLSWRKIEYRAILLAAMFGCVSNLAAFSNTGGASNYWILPWFLILLTVPAGLRRIEQWTARHAWIPAIPLALGVFLFIHQRNLLTRKVPADVDAAGVRNLKMLSDSPYLEIRSREPQFLDPTFYNQLSQQKVWSNAPIFHQIDGENYDLLLIKGKDGAADSEFLVTGFRGTSTWGAGMLDAMKLHYRAVCELDDAIALAPRDRSDIVQAADMERIFHKPCHATGRMPRLDVGMR